jgi:hypothetical protein
MKRNFVSIFILLIAILSVIFSSCAKISKPTPTTPTLIRGILIDSVKNKKIPNQRIVLVSCYAGNFRVECGNFVGSTVTNTSGEFEISFNATNNPFGFEVRGALDSNFYYSISTSEKITVPTIKYYTLYARELNYLKANIRVSNNPFERIGISTGNTNHFLNGNSIDTLLYFRILPNLTNQIIYTVFDANFGKYRQIIDTIQIGLSDTTSYNKTIPNTQNFPLQ